MNRQTMNQTQKAKNSTILPASDILQRKLINRTEFETPAVDTINSVEQQADNPSLKVSESHFNHDFSKIPVRSNASFPIQAKLKIGQPNDKYEQEADRVADQVMRMPDPGLSSSVGDSVPANGKNSNSGTIQRTCAFCSGEYKTAVDEERPVQPANLCPKCRTQEGLIQTKQVPPQIQRQESGLEEEEEELLQAKTSGGVRPEVTPAMSSGIQSLQGGGQPLTRSERSFFEPQFGANFSNVRVHNDSRASNLARSVNARAFTHGNNVVFGRGEYDSDSVVGRRLLAHELTHVAQQRTYVHNKKLVQRYRNSNSVNFGAKDTPALKEKQFDSSIPDPYVKHINVKFTSTKKIDNENVPMGKLSADYASNGAKSIPSNFSGISILGGFPSSGLTDKTTNNKVDRVEGWGYHHLSVPKGDRVGSKWPKFKYFKPAKGAKASMSYALFFKGKIAIHLGGLDSGSLACVHVDNDSKMKRLNYHTRAGVTKVSVTYNEAALKNPCCERYRETGRMVKNPCGGRDHKKC